MLNKFAVSLVLVVSTAASAAIAADSAAITEKDTVAVVAMADNMWSVAAVDRSRNLTKLREFHDVGDRGVQQIDYVVSCAKGQLALAGFTLLTADAFKAERVAQPTYADLSFYQPVIQHDISIVANVCGERSVAMYMSSDN